MGVEGVAKVAAGEAMIEDGEEAKGSGPMTSAVAIRRLIWAGENTSESILNHNSLHD